MATSLRVEDRLDGSLNFSPWKERIKLLLREMGLWSIVYNTEKKPVVVPTTAVELEEYERCNITAMRVILDAVKDHIVPHVSRKDRAFEMWDALTKLYQSSNQNRKMILREKLRSVKMVESESVTSYLTRVTQIRDELTTTGEVINDDELVRVSLNGFSEKWAIFVKGVVSRERLPKWDRLWDDFIQEETREEALLSRQAKIEDKEENMALIAKKGKGKMKFVKDLSKVRCYACNQFGHYAGQCPNKKKKKEQDSEIAATAEAFAHKFEEEFAFVSTVSSCDSNGSEINKVWIVDSGASNHMTGTWDMFFNISELEPRYIVNGMYAVRGTGRVHFQLQTGELLEVEGVLFVPGLGKNLLSGAALEDVGYTTLFRRGRVFIHSESDGLDNMVLLGERRGHTYMLLGHHMSEGSGGWLSNSNSMSEKEWTEVAPSIQSSIQGSMQEAASSSSDKRVSWYDMTLMDEQSPEQRQPKQFTGRVAEPASETEGASTNDPGGGTGRTSLVKREC